ncbi:MAG TPA: molecular chaperone DnaJ, partial [Myxococcales bacterium]|nr:molecular chaperone DnaJ [Myxococcales bacterium]
MPQAYPDHYRLLGSPVDASHDHLKEAYRRLSRLYHPDLHEGSR